MNTQNGSQMWAKMLTEQFGVKDTDKLNWVSQYAAIHEIHEAANVNLGINVPTSAPMGADPTLAQYGVPYGTANTPGVGPMYNTPLNTMGIGNPTLPGNLPTQGATPADFYKQTPGSGDIPVSTLPMALNIALMTIGLELVPVIPAKAPWAMLSYMDFPYAGGKLGRANETIFDGKGEGKENKPIYVKLGVADASKYADLYDDGKYVPKAGDDVTCGALKGTYKTKSMLDGGIIVEVKSCGDANTSVREAVAAATTIVIGEKTISVDAAGEITVDFAEAMADFVDGFANFANGSKNPMTRAENETGTGNQLSLRLFTKMVQMGAYEVTGAVTRQQLQDLPLYGVDAVGKIMEAMQNEITQHINARILERVFRLGVMNAAHQYYHNGTDLNLYFGAADADTKAIEEFGIKEYVDIYDQPQSWDVQNVNVVTSYDNFHTTQRRISSRMLAAANLIQVTGRRGRANWAVTNSQIMTALQDCADYVVAPMTNNLSQDGSQNLYMGGTVAGLKLYVDPYMEWNDTRICVGRKGNGNEPGVIFMPYILADTVSITAEGTMAPKMLINSRFAIVDAGFYPELQYYTIAIGIDSASGVALY